MTSYIRLTPGPEENTYMVFKGEKTAKKTGLFKRREITPIIFAAFREDISLISDEHDITYCLDCALNVGNYTLVPGAQRLAVGTAKPYEFGVVVETGLLPVVDEYRTVRIIEDLPSINIKDLRDVRHAQDFVREYRIIEERTGYNTVAALGRMDREPKEKYLRTLRLNDLVECLESMPAGIDGKPFSLLDDVAGLVLAKPDIEDEALRGLLAKHANVQ